MDTIVVVLIVSVAAGYLVWWYIKKARTGGGCRCENMECPLNGGQGSGVRGQMSEDRGQRSEFRSQSGGSGQIEKCDGVVCEGKKCNDEPFQKL